jgi:hypothetical protein
MANTDSFIEEVNEELRRDRLFAMFKKWGWIPILLVLILVGGAAYREYSLAQQETSARAFGDALIGSLDASESAERQAALAAVSTENETAQALLALLLAAEQATGSDREAAAAGLRALADQPDLAPRYRDLALLKAHLLDPQEPIAALAMLDQLALPGRPYRPLAMEQQALVHIGQGDIEAGMTLLRLLEEDSQATPGLQQRTSQLIVAIEAGSALQDAPAQDAVADAGADDPAEESEPLLPEAADETGAAETGAADASE